MKFHGVREFARLLATGLADRIICSSEPAAEILILVPLNDASYRRRGFNQAKLLARFVAARNRGEVNNTQIMAARPLPRLRSR